MILRVIAVVATEIVGAVFNKVARSALRAVLPRRRRMPEHPSPKRVVVGAGAMFDRAALYETWAEAHGLAWTDARGIEYAGTYRGRRTEMITGLVDTPLPRSPEILVRVALEGIEATTLLERGADVRTAPSLCALTSLLDIEGVRDVAVTSTFVRLRFDPFVETAVLDGALSAFDAALESMAPCARATPYRA